MIDKFAKRLSELGYKVSDDDRGLLLSCVRNVEKHILNYCNLTAVPAELEEVFINRVCGEFLLLKLEADEIGGGDGGEVKSISEGDVSVTFFEGSGVRRIADRLICSGGGELECYRKIRWC